MSWLERIFWWHDHPSEPIGQPEFESESAQTVQKLESAGRALDRAVEDMLTHLAPPPRSKYRGH